MPTLVCGLDAFHAPAASCCTAQAAAAAFRESLGPALKEATRCAVEVYRLEPLAPDAPLGEEDVVMCRLPQWRFDLGSLEALYREIDDLRAQQKDLEVNFIRAREALMAMTSSAPLFAAAASGAAERQRWPTGASDAPAPHGGRAGEAVGAIGAEAMDADAVVRLDGDVPSEAMDADAVVRLDGDVPSEVLNWALRDATSGQQRLFEVESEPDNWSPTATVVTFTSRRELARSQEARLPGGGGCGSSYYQAQMAPPAVQGTGGKWSSSVVSSACDLAQSPGTPCRGNEPAAGEVDTTNLERPRKLGNCDMPVLRRQFVL